MLENDVVGVGRLALLYAVYRGIVAFVLCAVYAFDIVSFHDYYNSLYWYSMTLVIYSAITMLQLFCMILLKKHTNQILIMGLVDVICLGAIHYAIGQVSMHVGVLFVVTVFVINLVHDNKASLLLTVSSIISVIYLPFIDNFLKPAEQVGVFDSILLTIMFVLVSLIAKYMLSTYRKLKEESEVKTHQLEDLKEVAYNILIDTDTGYLVINKDYQIIFINNVAKSYLVDELTQNEDTFKLNSDFVDRYIADRLLDQNIIKFNCSLGSHEFFSSIHNINLERSLYLITFESFESVNERLHKIKLAALGQISASIAHEIRNPLSTISQAVYLLDGATPEKTTRYIGIISKQCGRIDQIIQSTLDMAKNKELKPLKISVFEMIQNIITDDLMDLKDKVDIQGGDDAWVMFDEGHFRQVVSNLIRNAVRHNNDQISKNIQVLISTSSDDESIYIDFIDHGDGVQTHVLENLFTPFVSTEVSGTGLGLYLVKSLCESNQAKVEYVERSVGACFRITCIKVQ